jgi:hypothetical protein
MTAFPERVESEKADGAQQDDSGDGAEVGNKMQNRHDLGSSFQFYGLDWPLSMG